MSQRFPAFCIAPCAFGADDTFPIDSPFPNFVSSLEMRRRIARERVPTTCRVGSRGSASLPAPFRYHAFIALAPEWTELRQITLSSAPSRIQWWFRCVQIRPSARPVRGGLDFRGRIPTHFTLWPIWRRTSKEGAERVRPVRNVQECHGRSSRDKRRNMQRRTRGSASLPAPFRYHAFIAPPPEWTELRQMTSSRSSSLTNAGVASRSALGDLAGSMHCFCVLLYSPPR